MYARRTLLVKLDKPPGGVSRISYSEPIGICYIAAFLTQHGVDCRLLHLFQESPESALRNALTSFAPDIVGFSVRNFNLAASQRCIAMIRREFPDSCITVGGECVTPQHFEQLTRFIEADYFVLGDGETAMLALASGARPATVPGLIFKDGVHGYQFSGKPTHAVPPSQLPMMSRDGLPMDEYSSEGFPGKRYATLHALRGCRYWCTFCHTAGRYTELDSRSPAQILAEIDHLAETHGTEALVIWDEDFFANPER